MTASPDQPEPGTEPPKTPPKAPAATSSPDAPDSENGTRQVDTSGGCAIAIAVLGAWCAAAFVMAMLLYGLDGEWSIFLLYFFSVLLGVPLVIFAVVTAVQRMVRARRRREELILRRKDVLTNRIEVLTTVVTEAKAVSNELELYLQERLAALDALSAQVEEKERLAALTPEQVKALEKALQRQFVGQNRSGLAQQAVFLVLAFVLGFVVNWLSDPALDWLEGLWTSLP
ncbi:hypothetical protein ACWENQ_20040 [Nonomuraea sp. NPDC004354]